MNKRMQSQSTKWKVNIDLDLPHGAGLTALHYDDVEIVEQYGADPYIENEMDTSDMVEEHGCERAFFVCLDRRWFRLI